MNSTREEQIAAKTPVGPSRFVKNPHHHQHSIKTDYVPSSPSYQRAEDVKLRRRESSKSKSQNDRKSFFGFNWFRHKTEPNEAQKGPPASKTGDSRKKKPSANNDSMSSVLTTSKTAHLSDSLPSLVVQAGNEQRVVRRHRDVDVRDDSHPPSSGTQRTPSGRNRWSSYDIVLRSSAVDDNNEGDTIPCIPAASRPPGPPPSLDHNFLAVNAAATVVRARSADTLQVASDELGPTVEVKTAVDDDSSSDDGLESDVSRVTSNDRSRNEADQLGGGGEDLLIANLRTADQRIDKASREKKKLVASLLHIPSADYESVSQIARQSSHSDHDAWELLLTSLVEADRLTSCVDSLLRSCVYGAAADENETSAEMSRRPALPGDGWHRVSPQLADISCRLRRQLSLLLQSLEAEKKESFNSPECDADRPSATSDIAVAPSSECIDNDDDESEDAATPGELTAVAPPTECIENFNDTEPVAVIRTDAQEEKEANCDDQTDYPTVTVTAAEVRSAADADGSLNDAGLCSHETETEIAEESSVKHLQNVDVAEDVAQSGSDS